MGRQIIRVPVGFIHPTDDTGTPIPGAHLELLWDISPEQLTAYQVYENVSEGTPVSPAFGSADELRAWLLGKGVTAEAAETFIQDGCAPGFEFSLRDGVQNDMTGLVPPSE